jgi:hypothetical protein
MMNTNPTLLSHSDYTQKYFWLIVVAKKRKIFWRQEDDDDNNKKSGCEDFSPQAEREKFFRIILTTERGEKRNLSSRVDLISLLEKFNFDANLSVVRRRQKILCLAL